MWRDLGQYLRALWKHFGGLATGAVLTVALLVWQYVLKRGDIPMLVLGVAVGAGLFMSGFQAWREEHGKVAGHADTERRDEQQRLRTLAAKMVEEYIGWARVRHDAGPHALARLGLHALKSDALIREAIQEMYERSGTNPWSGSGHHVEDVDLVKFFTWVREINFDFLKDGTVEDVAKQVRVAGGHRPAVKTL